jgi:hypothetical protein
MTIDFAVHAGTDAVAQVAQEIARMQAGRQPLIKQKFEKQESR